MSTQRLGIAAFARAVRGELMVAPGEGRIAAYFLALFFLLGAGFALGRGSASSLFVQRFGVQFLPQVFVALSICLAVASLGYAAIADRIRPDRLLVILVAALLAVLLPLWLVMAWTGLAHSYPVYFIVFQLASEILLLQAMLYFGLSVDTSQAKRLLPIALAGMQAGEMAGGLGLTALAAQLPMHHVPVLWASLLALAAVLTVFRHARGRGVPPVSAARKSLRPWRSAAVQVGQGLQFAGTSPLLRNLALATFFTVVAVHVLEYCSFVIFADAFRSEAELGIVFGLLTFVCGAITLLIQLFFTGKLLRRHGVRRVSLIFPFSLLAAFGALAMSFKVLAALAGSVTQRTLLPALRNPSRALLFQALPDHLQGRVRALTLAVVVPVGILLAALVVRAVPSESRSMLLPLAGLIAAAGYLWYSIAANNGYPGALLDTLGERLFIDRGFLGRLDPVRDHALLERLLEGVRHSDDSVALAFSQALTRAFPVESWRYTLPRAREAGQAVQDQMIRLVAEHLPDAQRGVLRGFVGTGDDHQRGTILSILFAFRDADAREWVGQCFESDNPRILACGIQGAYDYPIEALLPEARARWRDLLGCDDPGKLLAGLDLARARPEREWTEFVVRACEHPDERVRRAALATLDRHAVIAGGALAPRIRRLLSSEDPEARAAAVRCAAGLPEIERHAHAYAALNDPHPKVSAAAVAALADHHGAAFADAALDWLADDALPARAQRVLVNRLLGCAASPRRFVGYAMRKAEAALALSEVLQALRRVSPEEAPSSLHRLLMVALQESTLECADLALLSMEGLEDRAALRRIRAAVTSGDARHFARATEALEGFRHRNIAACLRRAFESFRGNAPLAGAEAPMAESFSQIVDYLSQYPDAFLRECARYGQRVTQEIAT